MKSQRRESGFVQSLYSRFAFLAFLALLASLEISNLCVLNARHGFDSRRLHQLVYLNLPRQRAEFGSSGRSTTLAANHVHPLQANFSFCAVQRENSESGIASPIARYPAGDGCR